MNWLFSLKKINEMTFLKLVKTIQPNVLFEALVICGM